METVYFIAIVFALAVLIAWLALSPKKKSISGRTQEKLTARRVYTDRLTTPPDYLLARKHEIWRKKREAAPQDVIATNHFAPKSVSGGQPEYDGYSRRDRAHVVVGTAYIKKEDHVDEPVMKPANPKEGQAGSYGRRDTPQQSRWATYQRKSATGSSSS
jgi:hypothetical protein